MANLIVFKFPKSSKEEIYRKLNPIADQVVEFIVEQREIAKEKPSLKGSLEKLSLKEDFLKHFCNPKEDENHLFFMGSWRLKEEIIEFNPLEVRDIDGYGVNGLSPELQAYIKENTVSF